MIEGFGYEKYYHKQDRLDTQKIEPSKNDKVKEVLSGIAIGIDIQSGNSLPDRFALTNEERIVKQHLKNELLDKAEEVASQIDSLFSRALRWIALAYIKKGNLVEAERVIKTIKLEHRDLNYADLIKAYLDHKDFIKAEELTDQITAGDSKAYLQRTVIEAYCDSRDLVEAERILDKIDNSKRAPALRCIVRAYLKGKNVDEAQRIFGKIEDPITRFYLSGEIFDVKEELLKNNPKKNLEVELVRTVVKNGGGKMLFEEE